ncbi:hypothetical protein HDV06_002572 [Boothiomyces sp. JEL0866]|nr:hypothetical protein HDV06_002572 [Boothiomyces sp. JEL0866]
MPLEDLDVFESGLSTLFNEPEVNYGDVGETVTVQLPNEPKISLMLPDVEPSNVKLFAHHVWKGSVLLSKILQNRDIGGKVLELGAGCGLPSIVLARRGIQVVSSDYPDPDIIAKLNQNVKNNNVEIKVIGHIWGVRNDELQGKFDYIIMSDTLWMTHQHDNLLQDLDEYLAPKGTVIGVAGFHSGIYAVEKFFKLAEEKFECTFYQNFIIPIGHGLCEHMEWERAPEGIVISNDIKERSRYIFHYEFKRKS